MSSCHLTGMYSFLAATVYVLLIYLLSSRLPQGPVEQLLGALLGGS